MFFSKLIRPMLQSWLWMNKILFCLLLPGQWNITACTGLTPYPNSTNNIFGHFLFFHWGLTPHQQLESLSKFLALTMEEDPRCDSFLAYLFCPRGDPNSHIHTREGLVITSQSTHHTHSTTETPGHFLPAIVFWAVINLVS